MVRVVRFFMIRKHRKEKQMSKKLLTLALAVAFMASTATVSLAAKIKCTVDGVEGDKVSYNFV